MDKTLERYLSKVDKGLEDECWDWLGAKDRDGYGRIQYEGSSRSSHRIGYLLLIGPIASGLVVCHRCDKPWCQNPNHWFLGTVDDNNKDRSLKGRTRGVSQTHCNRGHLLEGYNLVIRPNGTRRCRECHNLRRRVNK